MNAPEITEEYITWIQHIRRLVGDDVVNGDVKLMQDARIQKAWKKGLTPEEVVMRNRSKK